MKPYFEEEVGYPAVVLIDSPVVYSEISGAQPIDLLSAPLSNTGQVGCCPGWKDFRRSICIAQCLLPFSLLRITSQIAPYNLSCEATYQVRNSSVQTYTASAALFVLPNPTNSLESLKYRLNLLLWYTGDEPDGTSDPLNVTSIAYDLIYSLDGYHPSALR